MVLALKGFTSMTTNNQWTQTTIRLEHKGYVGGAERDEDGYLQGNVEGLKDSVVVYDGHNLVELAANFVESIEEYLSDCKSSGLTAEAPKLLIST